MAASTFSICVGTLAIALTLWKCVCISRRQKRAKFLATLDPIKDAHKLLWFMYSVEFPFLTQNSLEFGTLQTLGIPAITSMLNKSKYGLKDPSKRAAETNIIVSEFIHHHVDSDRGSYAIQRLNAVHAQFKISNQDFLYVLCLNVLNPIDFASRFGYRGWTESEQLAAFTVWHDVGVRMGIKDIPQGIAGMRSYVQDFEAKYAVFNQLNHNIVQGLKHLVLDAFPWFVRPLAERGASVLLNDRLRVATGLPEQPLLLKWFILGSIRLLAGTFVGLFMPPRPVSKAKTSIQVDWSPNPAANPDQVKQLNHNRDTSFQNWVLSGLASSLAPLTASCSAPSANTNCVKYVRDEGVNNMYYRST